MKKIITLTILCGVLLFNSCDDNKPEPSTNNQPQALCDSLNITYNAHIKTIVDANCNTVYCHATGVGGIKLGTYTEVKSAAEKDNFLGAIKHENGFEAMPKNAAKLNDTQIQQFECWEKTSFKEN